MKCLFKRKFFGNGEFKLLEQYEDGLEWLFDDSYEVLASRKWDGTSIYFDEDRNEWFCRYDNKKGIVCINSIPCEDRQDPITGHFPHWTPVSMCNEHQFIREAIITYLENNPSLHGTYEAIGEKINGNAEGIQGHDLKKHGDVVYKECPKDFEGIKRFLTENTIEGVVFASAYGDMCKIRRHDFGIPWGKSR